MSTDLSKERWAVARFSTKRFGLGCAGRGAFMLLQTIYQDAHEQEMKDVATLISAAPELLEACQMMLVCMKLANWEGDEAAIRAQAAIAKATGEQP